MKLSEIFELKRLVRTCNGEGESLLYYVSDVSQFDKGKWSCCLYTMSMFHSVDFDVFMEFFCSHDLLVSISALDGKPYFCIQ